ncbi:MYOSIN-BINDING PROTEIN 2 [Salix viminalis]|uniref:MYOSIN-BINDING PROTEIN 2 n=1 Tax=Salix viminalis TaxID=40686 RepID=A0A9Q0NVK7_SALVM|nr:MYOSIN-BINDING PROTEIN 2 [Salix viminalis]
MSFLGSYQQIHPPPVPGHLLDFPRKSFLDETGDTSESTEVDDDSILQDLKKQVRLDRRLLMALYMELDEERSSSAVAANNAMAMINRLQAERAAVQMEAMQYERMMEEQAAYDREVLQATTGCGFQERGTNQGSRGRAHGLQRKIWCPFGARVYGIRR